MCIEMVWDFVRSTILHKSMEMMVEEIETGHHEIFGDNWVDDEEPHMMKMESYFVLVLVLVLVVHIPVVDLDFVVAVVD